MSPQVCPPHMLESSAIITISRKSWCFALPVLGSSTSLKQRENPPIACLLALLGVAVAAASGARLEAMLTLMCNRPEFDLGVAD